MTPREWVHAPAAQRRLRRERARTSRQALSYASYGQPVGRLLVTHENTATVFSPRSERLIEQRRLRRAREQRQAVLIAEAPFVQDTRVDKKEHGPKVAFVASRTRGEVRGERIHDRMPLSMKHERHVPEV